MCGLSLKGERNAFMLFPLSHPGELSRYSLMDNEMGNTDETEAQASMKRTVRKMLLLILGVGNGKLFLQRKIIPVLREKASEGPSVSTSAYSKEVLDSEESS